MWMVHGLAVQASSELALADRIKILLPSAAEPGS